MNTAEQKLRSEVEQLASAYAKYEPLEKGYTFDYSDIEDCDRHKLAALFLEVDGRDLHSIYENKADLESEIIKLLNSEDKETAVDFATTLKDAIASHYEKNIIDLFQDVLSEMTSEIQKNAA